MLDSQDLTTAVFAKTALGQEEIQSRSLGLLPLVRRILVLVDGKRSMPDLAALLPEGNDATRIVQELIDRGCVQVQAQAKAQPAAMAASVAAVAPASAVASAPKADADTSASSSAGIKSPQGLPPASSRTAKENDMARHFMINSVNSIIGQGMRISLIHDIFHADTTEKLREVYFAWEASMSNHGMGARRLPELRGKLFKVL